MDESVWELCLSSLVQSSCQTQCLPCRAASWHLSIVHTQAHLTWGSSALACAHTDRAETQHSLPIFPAHSGDAITIL